MHVDDDGPGLTPEEIEAKMAELLEREDMTDGERMTDLFRNQLAKFGTFSCFCSMALRLSLVDHHVVQTFVDELRECRERYGKPLAAGRDRKGSGPEIARASNTGQKTWRSAPAPTRLLIAFNFSFFPLTSNLTKTMFFASQERNFEAGPGQLKSPTLHCC